METPIGLKTADSFDLQFGVNYIAHYYLTTKLLPKLRNAKSNLLTMKSPLIKSPTHQDDGDDNDCNSNDSEKHMIRLLTWVHGIMMNTLIENELKEINDNKKIIANSNSNNNEEITITNNQSHNL